jgi:amidohydrolase
MWKSEERRAEIEGLFNYLHEHPEPSWEEKETTAYLKNFLEERGITVRTFRDIPGFTADIGQGKPVTALRADMDALLQNVEGEYKANHSCGHDAHMTMVTAAALMLKDHLPEDGGTLRLIYQPAEEKGTGALRLVEEGVVDDVDFLFGIHLRPKSEIPFGSASVSINHGAAMFLHGEITGRDVHGARPHLGPNAIETGAEILQQLRHIHLPPLVPHSIKMTKFQAGGDSPNIIPGSASFSLDVRTQSNEAMTEAYEKIQNIIRRTEENGTAVKLTQGAEIAAAEISPEAEKITEAAVRMVLGPEHTYPRLTTSGGDDFHYYTLQRPHLHAAMIGLGADVTPGLHDAGMTFNREALFAGTDILYEIVLESFRQ